MHLLDQMHSGQQHLLHLWQIKKTKLEQCLQLRIFEQDCEKVLNLISLKHKMAQLGSVRGWLGSSSFHPTDKSK